MATGIWVATTQVGFSDIPGEITLNIFTVGCARNCSGCHTPMLQDPNFPAKKFLLATELIQRVKTGEGLYSALCWMGGEPLFQQDALEQTVTEAVAACPVKHMLFTGHEFKEIPKRVLPLFHAIKTGAWKGVPVYQPNSNQKLYAKTGAEWKQVDAIGLTQHFKEGA